MPLIPFFRLDQNVSTSLPSGIMAPRPVITTLRPGMGYSLKRRRTEPSTGSHSNALNGLEQFALGFDRGCDDDLRLLEFGNIARADITHARGDCAYEVLAAIVNFCRSKQDLVQGSRRADFDPRSSWKICMRSRHTPVIATPRRFVCFGERAANHDCVGAAGQGLTNV